MVSHTPDSASTKADVSPSDLESGRYVPDEKVLNPDVHHHQDDGATLDEYSA
jgi:hypothetical protein